MDIIPEKINLGLPDSEILYLPDFLKQQEADAYYQHFFDKVPWKQDPIRIFGKTFLQPRLTALYGENGKSYSYSGIVMDPIPFDKELGKLKRKTEEIAHSQFTSCLLNLYRHGMDSNGWHADDEKELGINPVIASISFGQERIFHFRHKRQKELKHKILLEHGSLLLMKGETQHHWQHQIPKSRRPMKPRINLTFRYIK